MSAPRPDPAPDSPRRPIAAALVYGVASAVLYALLFSYADQFTDWARRTRDGEKVLALIPLVVAFAFSWVHGAFTGHFWEVLGLRAAADTQKKPPPVAGDKR